MKAIVVKSSLFAALFAVGWLLSGLITGGCNSVQSVGVTAGYGNETISVGVIITFKVTPSDATVAALEAANAVRIKSAPEVWAIGRYRIEDKAKVQAVDAALKDGGVIERIE